MKIVTKKTIIINPIEAQRLSSPSISSNTKVAVVPAIIAKLTRNQNNLFSFLSFSLLSASLIGGSAEGVSGTDLVFSVSGEDSDFSVSGISFDSSLTDSFFGSVGSGVGLDFFLFESGQVNF